jgi:hypothetical protein
VGVLAFLSLFGFLFCFLKHSLLYFMYTKVAPLGAF